MTNILLFYPDIPYYSYTKEMNRTTSSPWYFISLHNKISNLADGYRHTYFNFDLNTTSPLIFDFDYGSSRTVNYIAIAGVDRLKFDGVTTVLLEGSTNGSSYSTIKSLTLSSLTLVGQNSADYYETFTASSSYRYFRVTYTATGSAKFYTHNKLFFGSYFDFGREPSYLDSSIIATDTNAFRMSGGFIQRSKNKPNIRKIELEWKFLTDAMVEDFESKIGNKYHHCFIATDSDHEVLNNNKLIYCEVTNYQVNKVKEDLNILSVDFEEQEG